MSNETWQTEVVAALKALAPAQVPALEILLIDGFAQLIFGDLSEELFFGDEESGQVVSVVFNALINAAELTLSAAPVETEGVRLARELVVVGANDLGEAEVGLNRLIDRLLPAFAEELEANTGNAGSQLGRCFFFALMGIASGVQGSPPQPAAEGIDEVFGAWDRLMAEGWRLPWRT
jgi:hypothetical protein